MLRISKQKGIALLAFALLIVVGLSAVLVNKLETNTTFYERQLQNTKILEAAKAALIGYAINFPEVVNPDLVGGYLPCPDITNDGFSIGSCSEAGNTNIGLFPHETLETQEFLDASGEKLWYVVSQNFRNNPRSNSLNSETNGSLSVDSNTDIVALIIAPGEVIGSQNRGVVISSPVNEADTVVDEYLEDDNNDLDTNFVTTSTGDFNDRIITITRKDIMQAVEKRVLKYLNRELENYYTNNGNFYPWLSPFANPETSTFKSALNTYEGHLPFHYSNTNPSQNTESTVWNTFETELTIEWNSIANATINATGTVEIDCLINIDCGSTGIPVISSLSTATPVSCAWTDRLSLACESMVFSRTVDNYDYDGCNSGIRSLTRTYTIDFPSITVPDIVSADLNQPGIIVTSPTISNVRNRRLKFIDTVSTQTNAIQIQDSYTGCSTIEPNIGLGTLSFTNSTTADITLSNIRYDLDVDNGELEEWFVINEWHKYIYIVYSNSSIDGTNCTVSTDCLSLQNENGVYSNTNKVVAIAMGEALSSQTRPSANLADYLENENANSASDNLLEKLKVSQEFNDQIIVVSEN